MRCRECGSEVDNEKAFCPVCGAPMKVTADYEYIQAEIANKVDQYFQEKEEEKKSQEMDLDQFISEEKKKSAKEAGGKEIPRKSSKAAKHDKAAKEADDLAKTININSDSIFDLDFEDSVFDNEDSIREDSFDELPEEEWEDDELPPAPVKRKASSGRHSQRPRYHEDHIPKKKNQTGAKVLTVLVIFVIIAAAVIGILAILGIFDPNKLQNSNEETTQTSSSISSNIINDETYKSPVTIMLESTSGSTLYYTLDGSEPTTESRLYSGEFEISESDVYLTYPNVTLRVASFDESEDKLDEKTITFALEADRQTTTAEETEKTVVENVSDPVVLPAPGYYNSDSSISVTSAEGATIYYTYDGTIPDSSSNVYTGPVKMVPGTSTFSAVCILDGVSSSVVTSEYTLEYDYPYSADNALLQVLYELMYYGYVYDYDGNTYDGGHAVLSHKGVYTIDGYTYYIIEADFYTSDGVQSDTQYYGVGVNYGSVSDATPAGDSYYID